MDRDLAIRLCQTTRDDIQRLLVALERKEFYAVGHDIGQSAVAGLKFKDLPQELVRVEQMIEVDNLHPDPDRECPVANLVNYYDRLLDQIRLKRLADDEKPPIITSVHHWRDNAGQLVQMICQIADDEPDQR